MGLSEGLQPRTNVRPRVSCCVMLGRAISPSYVSPGGAARYQVPYTGKVTTWDQIYGTVTSAIRESRGNLLFFRGHSQTDWRLEPGLARQYPNARIVGARTITDFEMLLHSRFTTRAGELLRAEDSRSWASLFAMQHHGLPTRLLDWTRTFSIALYFALRGEATDAVVWMLNPYELNRRMIDQEVVLDVTDIEATYEEYYLRRAITPKGDVVAITPYATNRRILQQHAAFTLHSNLETPLEALCPEVVTRINIPVSCRRDAKEFLLVSGISEFTLFPDLDGLARDVLEQILRP